jgi:hypothetical protein
MDNRERKWSRGRVVTALAVLAVGGYLAVARWKALHPGPGAARVVGPSFDLVWWR